MRYTEKEDRLGVTRYKIYDDETGPYCDYHNDKFCKNFQGKPIDKLGQLEDVEEELGIDLVTLFKALKNGIYVDENYMDFGTTNNFLCPNNLDYFDVNLKQIAGGIYFKDYGKTWALTKEELNM